ncbi:MAG: hopanoid biosynthesis-associated protein HpnK [Gammaproteobacteria bacterium]|nr:hopanoid biosynthesis-associated protein HpnK [Gammaproteobacteria bacterium]
MKRLIVTADDFGAAPEVNAAVEAAHREGILTAASLMVAAPAAADAIARARRRPGLHVGLHLTLLEGRPLLPAAAVPHLVDGAGNFPRNPVALGARLVYSRAARTELAAEIKAQLAAFSDSGLTLDHCNAHLHFHLHPLIGPLIVALGAHFGLRAVRVPLEPLAVLRRIEPLGWSAPAALTVPFAQALRRRLAASGLLVADRTFGLRWSGHMTPARLAGLIHHLPDGVSEIYLHPATGPYPGAARGYQYAEELRALTAAEVAAACRERAVRLGGFADFVSPAAAPPARATIPAQVRRPGAHA